MREQAFFDVHTHIIPNVDDGAANADVALEMLEASFAQGVRDVVLTPHYNEARGLMSRGDAQADLMRALAAQVSPELRVHFGNELLYSSGTIAQLKTGSAMTLAGSKYVLVEFESGTEYARIVEAVNDLVMHGFWPILAHVERYDLFHTSTDKLIWLVKAGAYFQVNANSFLSKKLAMRMFLRKLIANDLVHFIASDCHNTTTRKPNIKAVAELLEKKYGSGFVRRVLVENPSNILNHTR